MDLDANPAEEAHLPDPQEEALRLLYICAEVVADVLETLSDPSTPDGRTDLLLATESLAEEVSTLLRTTRTFAWGSPYPDPPAPKP